MNARVAHIVRSVYFNVNFRMTVIKPSVGYKWIYAMLSASGYMEVAQKPTFHVKNVITKEVHRWKNGRGRLIVQKMQNSDW